VVHVLRVSRLTRFYVFVISMAHVPASQKTTCRWVSYLNYSAIACCHSPLLGSNVVSDINRLTSIHEVLASEHRLNQRPQNAALQSAAMIKQRTETLKKLANKSRTLDIVLGLWVFPADGGAAKKVCNIVNYCPF